MTFDEGRYFEARNVNGTDFLIFQNGMVRFDRVVSVRHFEETGSISVVISDPAFAQYGPLEFKPLSPSEASGEPRPG